MFVRILFSLVIVAVVVLSLGWVGCSDNKSTTTTFTDSNSNAGTIKYYFPVSEGQVSTYQIRNGDGTTHQVTLQVGPETQFNGQTASIWLVNNHSGLIDTSYSVVTSSAVYFYENAHSDPELILQLPLQPGSAWSRFGYTNIETGYGTTDTTTAVIDTTQGRPNAKVFPTEGSDILTVDKVESVTLSDGNVYSSAVRVSNAAANGTTNYYWYVPGIGLTKYVLGATDAYPNGQTMGELVSYHR
jgi:hypothetical protein